jgi:hypothetical protein
MSGQVQRPSFTIPAAAGTEHRGPDWPLWDVYVVVETYADGLCALTLSGASESDAY